MYNKGKKVVATMLLFILTVAQLSTVGQVFASNILEEKTNITNEEQTINEDEKTL